MVSAMLSSSQCADLPGLDWADYTEACSAQDKAGPYLAYHLWSGETKAYMRWADEQYEKWENKYEYYP